MTWTVPDQGEPANDLQAVLFQSTLDALAAGHSLTGVVSGCACAQQASPDMTVAVAAGTVTLAGVPASVVAGNVTIGAADATNPRLDLIVVNGSGTKSVIAGTAAAAPKEPTLDTTTSIALAQVYVPATATTITTARITDRRVVCTPRSYGGGAPAVFASGNWTGIFAAANASAVFGTSQTMYCFPFFVQSLVSVTDVCVNVNTAGATGSTIRMGLYASANGIPTSLIADWGTVAGDTTGAKTITFGSPLTLVPGVLYYFAYVGVSSGTMPNVLTSYNSLNQPGSPPVSLPYGTSSNNVADGSAVTQASVSGALPGTVTPSYQSGFRQVPAISMKAA